MINLLKRSLKAPENLIQIILKSHWIKLYVHTASLRVQDFRDPLVKKRLVDVFHDAIHPGNHFDHDFHLYFALANDYNLLKRSSKLIRRHNIVKSHLR